MSDAARFQIPEAFRELPIESARYKGFHGGRGSAKSHSFAQALVILGAQQPRRILCCREIQRSIRDSVKRLLDDTIERKGLSGFYDSTETEIRGANGTLFLFSGVRTNPEMVQSLEAIDIAWIEEAHRVSRRSLEILIPTIRQPGSEIWASWNPNDESDPIDAMLRGPNPPSRSIVRKVSWRDNPFFPDVLREEMEWDLRRDPDKHAHVWEGHYRQISEARVFRNWRVEEFSTPTDVRLLFGADWGFANDPTVLIRCWLDGSTLYVDREAYKIGCEIDKTPALFDQVPGARGWSKERSKYVPGWPVRADSARPETISYMRRHGFNIRAAKKGKGSVEDGVEYLKSFDIVVHPLCRHTIDELTHFRYKIDKHTDEVLPVLQDANNHVVDALRYATESIRRRGAWGPA